MIHLGFNIYWWSNSRPMEVLAALRHLTGGPSGSPRLFYDYFDSRGPHLFVLLSTAAPLAKDEILATLREALDREAPSEELNAEIVTARHKACSGKELCSIDAGDLLVPHRELLSFEQPESVYPFWLGRHLGDSETFWQLFSDLTLMGLDLLLAGPAKQPGTGIEWLTALDEWLESQAISEPYWRYHLATLMPGLRDELQKGNLPQTLLDGLESSIGERNREVFAKIRRHDGRRRFETLLPKLCSHAIADDGELPFLALREVNHVFLKQLGVPPVQQLPFVLSSWLHHYKSGQPGEV